MDKAASRIRLHKFKKYIYLCHVIKLEKFQF